MIFLMNLSVRVCLLGVENYVTRFTNLHVDFLHDYLWLQFIILYGFSFFKQLKSYFVFTFSVIANIFCIEKKTR